MSARPPVAAGRLAAIAALIVAAACAEPAPPRVEVSRAPAADPATRPSAASEVVRAKAGARVDAQFTIRNSGGRDLVLHGIVRDCDCQVASTVPATLGPGDSAGVTVACRAPLTEGSVVRELRLVSDDPSRPIEPLRIAITAEPADVRPSAVYFGYVALGASVTRAVAIGAAAAEDTSQAARTADEQAVPSPTDGTPPLRPVVSDPAVTVDPKPAPPERGREYVLRFTPTAPGPFHADVDFGNGKRVAVSGVGFRGVLAYPAEVRLPSPASAGGPPPIALKGVGEEPLDIMRVDFPEGLAGDLQAVTPGHEYLLRLRARGVPTTPSAIRIHTSSATEPELAIPIVVEERL